MNDKTEIERSLAEIGAALGRGDAAGVAELWEVPAQVLPDRGAIPVAARTLREVPAALQADRLPSVSRCRFRVRPFVAEMKPDRRHPTSG